MNDVKPEGKTFDLVAHLIRQRDFSQRTFGPGTRSQGVVDHIRKELKEIEADPLDLKEWIDVVLLALDGAWRAGYEPAEIAEAIEAKQTKNEGRTWPDWRTADPGKAIEHVRTTPPQPTPADSTMDEIIQRMATAYAGECGQLASLYGMRAAVKLLREYDAKQQGARLDTQIDSPSYSPLIDKLAAALEYARDGHGMLSNVDALLAEHKRRSNLSVDPCDEADAILMAFGLNPRDFRTDAGWLNLPRLRTHIKEQQPPDVAIAVMDEIVLVAADAYEKCDGCHYTSMRTALEAALAAERGGKK